MTSALAPKMSVTERILDCFPSGTYAITALLRLASIVESDTIETAAVECTAQPRMLINPGFIEQWADTPEKLLMLVMHELHHVLLGHTRLFPTVTNVDNLVFDAVINSLLCRMFPDKEHTCFFTDFYSDSDFPACLLRPPARWRPDSPVSLPPALTPPRLSQVGQVYRSLYSQGGASYHDLYEVLRGLVNEVEVEGVILIGDHGGGSAGGNLDQRSPILFEAVRTIVERWPQPPDPVAGRSLADIISDDTARPQPPSNRSILRSLMRRIANPGGNKRQFRGIEEATIYVDTPLPTLDRRSIVLNALGAPVLLHRGDLDVRSRTATGSRVHVYLDVSGSIGELKGALFGAVLDCRPLVYPTVHLFSNCVADVSLGELRRGVCPTTGGTDIDCVAEHMDQHRVRRAVIVTDGFVGAPTGRALETLLKVRIGVALTPESYSRNDLANVADHWAQLQAPAQGGQS